MNILFLTLSSKVIPNPDNTIYGSVLYELLKENKLYIVTPNEKRNNKKTTLIEKKNYSILKVKTGNITKTNVIEKGISTLLIENQYKRAIKKHFKNIKFDLILYATPPITFCNVIKYFKKRDNAKTYLMLKDIFPQNAVDLKMFSNKGIIYKYFRNKEKKLYKLSDKIGCMSPKNKEFLVNNNKYLDKEKIEIFPNSITIQKEYEKNNTLKEKYRKQYNIPLNAKVYIYGGNLGKPQGINFIIECLKKATKIDNTYFVICGTGTEYLKIENFIKNNNFKNIVLINGLSVEEYNDFINIGDIGLIFLDYNFTIPNFPSRLLSYMVKSMPILACTDPSTDIGDIIENNNFGWKCYSNNSDKFINLIKKINKLSKEELENIGNNGYKYLNKNYLSKDNYKKIINIMNEK